MNIPVVPRYPDEFDDDSNLFLVRDHIRLRLREDFNPGDTVIKCEGNPKVIADIPETGKITLTEQCSELDSRAVTYHYENFDRDNVEFSGLTLYPGFQEVPKQKYITNVTLNVSASDHNNIKDALIAIQKFVGVKGTTDNYPLGETMEGRVNFLRKIVLRPKAWFTSDVRMGIAPLCVTFEEKAIHDNVGGTSVVKYIWDFGDRSSVVSIISVVSYTDVVPDNIKGVLVEDPDGGKIKKCYYEPGFYTVKLTVENDFGSDTVIFEDYINVRAKAPEEAVINFVPEAGKQITTTGVPVGGPYDIPPTIRSPINTIIKMEIPLGENPNTPGYSYAGELLGPGNVPIDPIIEYTWDLNDDLLHENSSEATASYSVGGIYDLKLRVDTQYGSYRITTYEGSIDIVEYTNLWLWIFSNSTNVQSYEFGLISESFKVVTNTLLALSRNYKFLENENNSEKQIKEFLRNTGFAPRSTVSSGNGGVALLYFASGRNASDPKSTEKIYVVEYNAFVDSYTARNSIDRQWNWVNLNYPAGSSYFIFGAVYSYPPNESPTNLTKQTLALTDLSITEEQLNTDNFINNAYELSQNPAVYDSSGKSVYGNFSVYRTAWKDQTGYICRNDGVGPFFRIKSFYRTEGIVGKPFVNIRKMQDIQGPTRLEGQLTNLSKGVYFMDNSGSVSKFDDNAETWSTGGPGLNSLAYKQLQDTSVPGYSDLENTLLIASDGDKRAYLSFDYSENVFIKFNEIDLTFSSLINRPSGEQWLMGIY